MEKNANYTLVGLSTLILIFAVAIFIVWLARLSFARDFQLYDIVFKGPVRGLNQGGEVHFNGIKVGEVITIAKAGRPVAKLTRVDAPETPRRLGFLAGQAHIPDDFDELGGDVISDLFEGRRT